MKIDWKAVYTKYDEYVPRPKKFTVLPSVLEWQDDVEDNLWVTMEWLYRDGRRDEIRFQSEPHMHLISDHWYRVVEEEGKFVHICYPADLLKFRTQYESSISHIRHDMDGIGIMEIAKAQAKVKEKLWSAWQCIGFDGKTSDYWDVQSTRTWTLQCSRCGEAVPKGLRLWLAMMKMQTRMDKTAEVDDVWSL